MTTWQTTKKETRDMTVREIEIELARKATRIGTEDEEFGDDYVLIEYAWLPGPKDTIPGGWRMVKIKRFSIVLVIVSEEEIWHSDDGFEATGTCTRTLLTEATYQALSKRPQIIS